MCRAFSIRVLIDYLIGSRLLYFRWLLASIAVASCDTCLAAADSLSVRQGGTSSVFISAEVTWGCGEVLLNTVVQQTGQNINLSTPSINLGCAPPSSGGSSAPSVMHATEQVSYSADGVYFVAWTFPSFGHPKVLTTQFIVRNGQLLEYHPVPIGGRAANAALAFLVVLAAGIAGNAMSAMNRRVR